MRKEAKKESKVKVKVNRKNSGLVHPDACGIDIGSREIYVAVPAGRASESVRCFGTFTEDIEAIAVWLKQCKVRTAAMEATGVLSSDEVPNR